MRVHQIEAWALRIVDQVLAKQSVEDARVELKADWPDATKAARQIAGHANSATSEKVLWIVGLDEHLGPVAVQKVDIAHWRSQVESQFDGVSPTLTELLVPTEKTPVWAILIDTSRRPYVTRNPVHGSKGGGPVALEVPWRDGTAVRSARRDELMRILAPLQALPTIEILHAHVRVRSEMPASTLDGPVSEVRKSPHLSWDVSLDLYLTPLQSDLIVLPVHRANLELELPQGSTSIQPQELRLHTPIRRAGGAFSYDSQTISTTASEALIQGPGKLEVRAHYDEAVRPIPSTPLCCKLSFLPAGLDQACKVSCTLMPVHTHYTNGAEWAFEASGA